MADWYSYFEPIREKFGQARDALSPYTAPWLPYQQLAGQAVTAARSALKGGTGALGLGWLAPAADIGMTPDVLHHHMVAMSTPNLEAADSALHLTPQERALYQRHLNNLYGPGGVNNPDGSRSSLYQAVQEHDGRYYNVPTVWDGRREVTQQTGQDGQTYDVPNQTALDNIARAGWQNFPSYATPQAADERYSRMHDYMGKDTAAFLRPVEERT